LERNVLVLSNETIDGLISMQECLEALEPMYRDLGKEQALLSPRVDNISPNAHPGAYYAFKQMGGTWPARGIQALRINSDVITHPLVAGKPRRVKQPLADGRWVGLVFLFSTETGALLAIFPDGVVQRLRVGATNGIALKYLARRNARTLALIGTGWQAGAQLMAALAVRSFTRVQVYSPRAESRAAFVEQARVAHPNADIVAVDTPERCVEGADVIMAGTSSLVRVIEPAWLQPGVHISCIKAQEVNQAVLDRCDRVFVHVRQQAKQIDNVLPGTQNISDENAKGWWNAEGSRYGTYPDVGMLVTGTAPGRQSDGEITAFVNSVGLGLQFAAVGALIVEKAKAQGVGEHLPDHWFSENVHP
jgi:alanine dehydrogenase